MTLPVWPSSLTPYPKKEGFQYQPRENRIFFGTEVGQDKTRSRTTAEVVDISWSLDVTSSQVSTLDTFFNSTLTRGTKLFTITDPVRGGTAKMKFASQITYVPMGGGNFIASFKLVKVP